MSTRSKLSMFDFLATYISSMGSLALTLALSLRVMAQTAAPAASPGVTAVPCPASFYAAGASFNPQA